VSAPGDEPVPLITARCRRCGRVAAKYWERGGRGHWITGELDLPDLPKGASLAYMVARQHCECEPSPTLPGGGELAAHIKRAHAKRFDRRRAEAGRTAITIRV
jgi:hypothetical protein